MHELDIVAVATILDTVTVLDVQGLDKDILCNILYKCSNTLYVLMVKLHVVDHEINADAEFASDVSSHVVNDLDRLTMSAMLSLTFF